MTNALGQVAMGASFRRSVALLLGGNAAAMALPILAGPILGRIYPPQEYAALAQYMAVATILAVLATMQFQHAIFAEKSERAARQIVWLCLGSSLVVAGLALAGVALGWQLGLSSTAAGAWFWLLPLQLGTAGAVGAGNALANRLGNFGWMASLPVLQTVITIITSIVLGLLGFGSDGLLIAYMFGQTVMVFAYCLYLLRAGICQRRPTMPLLALYARRHWKFPAFTLSSEFSSQLNMQIPVFALAAIGADGSLGAFIRARQLVSLPITALGSAVAQVFRRDASEQYRIEGTCRPLMIKTGAALLAAGIIPCLVFVWAAPALFSIYLGPEWREAGELARILAPMLLVRLVVSPLTSVFYFTENQSLDLRLMLISTVIMAFAVFSAIMLAETAKMIVWAFSMAYVLIYLLYFVYSWRVANRV